MLCIGMCEVSAFAWSAKAVLLQVIARDKGDVDARWDKGMLYVELDEFRKVGSKRSSCAQNISKQPLSLNAVFKHDLYTFALLFASVPVAEDTPTLSNCRFKQRRGLCHHPCASTIADVQPPAIGESILRCWSCLIRQ